MLAKMILVLITQAIWLKLRLILKIKFNRLEKDLSNSSRGKDSHKVQVKIHSLQCIVQGGILEITTTLTVIILKREVIVSISHFKIQTLTIAKVALKIRLDKTLWVVIMLIVMKNFLWLEAL